MVVHQTIPLTGLTSNNMIRSIFILAAFFCLSVVATAQGELNCTVRINTPQLQRTDRKVFDQMEANLREWLNNSKWTTDNFTPEERIKCTFIITIDEERDNNSFKAVMAVQATRPVYGSSYETTLLTQQEQDFSFVYEQNTPIDFIPDNAENPNLTAAIAFYVYTILGLDYDSFSLYGGDQYFQKAQQLVVDVQNSISNKAPGWRPDNGDRNRSRYWLSENMTSPRLRSFRAAFYTYHRKGLDLFSTNPEAARAGILAALEDVDKASAAYINSMIIQLFAQAKRDEIVEMMKIAPLPMRQRIFQIMTKADPANTSRYREMGV
jgi:Domain of unknown function (DUF4835)